MTMKDTLSVGGDRVTSWLLGMVGWLGEEVLRGRRYLNWKRTVRTRRGRGLTARGKEV